MPTKIGGFDSSPVQVSTDRAVKRSDVAAAGSQPVVTTSSDAQITESARQLIALEQTVKDLPAIDEARVAQISAKLQDGSYEVDASRVADKLLQMEHALGSDT